NNKVFNLLKTKENNIKKEASLEQHTEPQLDRLTDNYNNTVSTSTSKDWASITEEEELVPKEIKE
ncbi:17013_t:CDS:1, partial [Racocetra fulgida]